MPLQSALTSIDQATKRSLYITVKDGGNPRTGMKGPSVHLVTAEDLESAMEDLGVRDPGKIHQSAPASHDLLAEILDEDARRGAFDLRHQLQALLDEAFTLGCEHARKKVRRKKK